MTAAPPETEICFGPYRLEIANARLLRGAIPVAVPPKALDVLHHLATHPGRLMTKDQLLSTLWADSLASDASVKVCVGEIRKALHDDARHPTYIQTVHRRGYRFIAPVQESAPQSPALSPNPLGMLLFLCLAMSNSNTNTPMNSREAMLTRSCA